MSSWRARPPLICSLARTRSASASMPEPPSPSSRPPSPPSSESSSSASSLSSSIHESPLLRKKVKHVAMRVAIFGGSFNPPHVGHQLAALWVLETAGVDELWFVPAFVHPFEKALAPFEDRRRMCERAAAALGP